MLTILSVAYPLLPVAPSSAGGAEQILHLVERGIVEAGHRSIVVAADGSQVRGELLPTQAFSGTITDEVRESAQRAHLRAIEQVLNQYSINLLHFHGLDFHRYLPLTSLPKLATLHLPPEWYPAEIFALSSVWLNCVSKSQAERTSHLAKVPVIANGIDLDAYSFGRTGKTDLLWIGRICPEKAVHIALQVAHRLDLPMIIAGPVHPFHDHRVYFRDQVEPLLDSRRRYAGAVDLQQKIALFNQAQCLLIPSLVAETSSLVAMEAFASGIPVIAYRSGALPEIVRHSVTGFIVDSEDEMAGAVPLASEISPQTCRCEAEMRFDSRRMQKEYLGTYNAILDSA